MIEFSHFLEVNHFPLSIISAVTSVYVQLIGSIFLLLGFRTRIAAFLLIINFIVALLCVHIPANDSIEGMTPALAMLFGCLTLLFTGADRVSVDHRFRST